MRIYRCKALWTVMMAHPPKALAETRASHLEGPASFQHSTRPKTKSNIKCAFRFSFAVDNRNPII